MEIYANLNTFKIEITGRSIIHFETANSIAPLLGFSQMSLKHIQNIYPIYH